MLEHSLRMRGPLGEMTRAVPDLGWSARRSAVTPSPDQASAVPEDQMRGSCLRGRGGATVSRRTRRVPSGPVRTTANVRTAFSRTGGGSWAPLCIATPANPGYPESEPRAALASARRPAFITFATGEPLPLPVSRRRPCSNQLQEDSIFGITAGS